MIAADPYPWPYDGVLEPGRLALVVPGAQTAWLDRSARGGIVATVIDRVASVFRSRGSGVVLIRHAPATDHQLRLGLPPARGSAEWQLAVEVEPGDLVVDAAGVDGFQGSPLDAELRRRGIDHLVLCGFGAEATVDSTLRSANDRGYECLTLVDAVAPFDEVLGRHALSSITMSGGIFGAIASSDALLTALNQPVLTEPVLTEAS